MLRHILTTLLLLLLSIGSAGARVRTTRTNLKMLKSSSISPPHTVDTITCVTDSMVTLSGFEKKLRSAKESLFITNHLSDTIRNITLDLTYLDTSGRQLHSRSITLVCEVPPGATRQLTFQTWDRQSSFYYFRSAKPRRANGTPFKLTCSITAIITSKN